MKLPMKGVQAARQDVQEQGGRGRGVSKGRDAPLSYSSVVD